MLTLIKLVTLIKTLHSEGTPGQVAAGIALGSVLGLTPLVNVHNLLIAALILILNVSVGGAMLGWALFLPLGFALDPVFDRLGRQLLLETPALTPMWTTWFNTPVLPYTNFNNTIVLGSLWRGSRCRPIYSPRAMESRAIAQRSASASVARASITLLRPPRHTMSTPGSVRSDLAGQDAGYTRGTAGPPPTDEPPTRRPRLVRWQGLVPLALLLVLVVAFWLLFGDRVVRQTAGEAATKRSERRSTLPPSSTGEREARSSCAGSRSRIHSTLVSQHHRR